MKTKYLLAPVLCILSLARGQVAVINSYSQNFDTLASTGSNQDWVDNSTLVGWYSTYDGIPTTRYYTVNGVASYDPALNAYGSGSDRALGTGMDFGVTPLSFGVGLSNQSGSLVTDFSVGFTGEQWARKNNIPQVADSLSFSYQIFAAGAGSLLVASGWVAVPALNFTSPNISANTLAVLDGNAPGNQTALFTTLTGMSLAPDQELWLRWTATALAGATRDHDIAIDDLTVTFGAIPEPASFAAIGGLAVLARCMLTRRRKTVC